MPARLMASLMTMAPSSAAGTLDRVPPNLPMAVRHADAMTIFFMFVCLLLWLIVWKDGFAANKTFYQKPFGIRPQGLLHGCALFIRTGRLCAERCISRARPSPHWG